MGKARKQPALNRQKPELPEFELDSIQEIVESVTEPSIDNKPITVDTIQDAIITRIETGLAESQAHLEGLTRRLERLAFSRQKAVNQDAVRYVVNRLNEQAARTQARITDLQGELAKELRLRRCRAEIKELEDEMQRHRTMSSIMEERLRKLQHELDVSTGIEHHEPIRIQMRDQQSASIQTESNTATAV